MRFNAPTVTVIPAQSGLEMINYDDTEWRSPIIAWQIETRVSVSPDPETGEHQILREVAPVTVDDVLQSSEFVIKAADGRCFAPAVTWYPSEADLRAAAEADKT